MVVPSLSLGALVGVALSGGFVYWEVGKYATPQVPATLFDERREVFAYTAGLFVGVPLAVALVLFLDSMANGALPGAAIFLVALLGGTEVAQWGLLRSRYWGHSESSPFYALGYRAAIGGILALAIVAQYLSGTGIGATGIALVLVQSAAILMLEVAGALLSLPPRPHTGRSGGGPFSGLLVGGFGFFLIGLGPLGGEAAAFGGAIVALLGGWLIYQRLRAMLATIPPPGAPPPAPPSERARTYRRTPAEAPGGPEAGGIAPLR